ncbi:hypothetical protein DFJ43DRAFT_392685 [Lentinula guzmanii]|uniref:Uncharacterized protein n=1 Tax=Lentinula guzmanii TaxID=2804957 RepID=A0AA38JJH9_9AGAR|nr:hypothetical protein DFJ43DRAFT_392685 [Lentinula guzmanii]
MSRSPFIDDLIPEILACNVWWPRDLCRLALVSPSWLFYARKLLYSRPSLRSFLSCACFARSIQNNHHLSSFIKGIELCPTFIDGHRHFGAEEMCAIRVILGLDGLRSVTLGGEMTVCAERFLNCLTHPHSLEELTIDGSLIADSLSARPSFEWDEVMANKFAAVRKMRFVHLELNVVYTSSPYQLQLADLSFENVDVISGNITWFLQDTTTLKYLRVLGESSLELDEQVSLVLQNYSVECLHYEVGNSPLWDLVLFDRSLAGASSLRSLYLNGVRVDSEILRTIHAQCPAMEQLYISGRYVPLTREEWVGCIASGFFPALRKLGLPEGTFCPPFIKWTASLEPALQKACALRGVDLIN